MISPQQLFEDLGGRLDDGFPEIPASVYHNQSGVPYFKSPGIAMMSKPDVNPRMMRSFLATFDEKFGFLDYLNDPTELPDGTGICKIFGQLCYFSFGPNRIVNCYADTYFRHIIFSDHSSALEHANYGFLLYGDSRSFTHESVRHRHTSPSQASQRYISGNLLRFVERPAYQGDEELHQMFEERIDRTRGEYEKIAEKLLKLQKEGNIVLHSNNLTESRKKRNETARSVLTNEVEAPLGKTANATAWRHYLYRRAKREVDIEMRILAVRLFLCLMQVDPILFGDYALEQLEDGTYALIPPARKRDDHAQN